MKRQVHERGLRVRKGRRRPPETKRQPANLRDLALYQEYLRSRTWLSVEQVMAYLDFPSPAAVRDWASRHGIRKGRRGRTLVFRRTTLDEAVDQSLVKA